MEGPSNQTEIPDTTTDAQEPGIARLRKKYQKPLRIIALILAVVFAVLIIFNVISKPYDRTRNDYTSVTIEEGDDITLAAERLQKAGIIESASKFSLVSKMIFQTAVKPGIYYLSPSMDSVAIAKAICKGNITLNGFIIPKGFSIDQTFSSLSRDGFGEKDAFMKAAADPFLQELEFIGNDVEGAEQIEGFLMPGSYRIESDADETMIIMAMLDSFNNFFNDDYKARADELGLSIRDVLVIASMIEKETSIDSERAALSSVIHNRINLGMISSEELPKVPLCSPGKESIIAALYPDDNEDTYYVLSSKLDGSHVFTADENEYNELKAAYDAALAEKDANTAEDEAETADGEEDSEKAPEGEN